MIRFFKETRQFLLSGKRFSYAFFVNEWGYLQTLHFGGKTSEEDLTYLRAVDGKPFSPIPSGIGEPPSTDVFPQEYSAFGQGDFRSPAVLIRTAEGARMGSFKYRSHKIEEGAPDLGVLPHLRGKEGTMTLCVSLIDEVSGLEIRLFYLLSEDSDILVRYVEYVNGTDRPLRLERAFSFTLDLPSGEYDVLRLQGRHMGERMPERTPLGHGMLRISSDRGASSHQMNPFLCLPARSCGEESGECFGASLLYSGSYALSAELSQTGSVRLTGGINDFGFSWELAPNETFVTPQVALAWSDRGLGGLSRAYSDFWREYVIPPTRAFSKRPKVINNWEGTYFDFDRDRLFAMIDRAADLGVDTFVLDDGWFGKRNDDTSGLGDWYVNERKLEGGLKPIADRCRERGLAFGLWFEPEMISPDSDLYRAHPDWAIAKKGVKPCLCRHQLVLDFSRREVVDHVFDAVSAVLSSCDISYVKWDMNRHITEFYSKALPPERQGELLHRHILGVYELASRLTNAFPDVFFEGCSGGGGRFDGGMLFYFPQIWTSDNTDGYARSLIEYGTSIAYPLSSMSCHISACPNHQTGRITPLETRAAIASIGATGCELDPTRLSREETEKIRALFSAYDETAELVLTGDAYRLKDPFRDGCFCMEIAAKDRSRAYVVGERYLSEAADIFRRVRLRGLASDRMYRIRELDLTISGAALEHAGLVMPNLPDFGSWVWHIERV